MKPNSNYLFINEKGGISINEPFDGNETGKIFVYYQDLGGVWHDRKKSCAIANIIRQPFYGANDQASGARSVPLHAPVGRGKD